MARRDVWLFSPARWRFGNSEDWSTGREFYRAASSAAPHGRTQLKVRTARSRFGAPERATYPFELKMKRCFDFIVASLLLVFLLPGLITIAIAIKATSAGPVLFRQQRYGLGGDTFEIFKFRTMFVETADPSGVAQTRECDPRVTPLGALLRRSSLDELPQLWNVVRGDMSLVGPRPHVPGMLAGGMLYEELVPYYFERNAMRAGITGLAQVNGLRGSTVDAAVAKARIDQDLQYIRHWSLALDIRILWETARREFLNGNGN